MSTSFNQPSYIRSESENRAEDREKGVTPTISCSVGQAKTAALSPESKSGEEEAFEADEEFPDSSGAWRARRGPDDAAGRQCRLVVAPELEAAC